MHPNPIFRKTSEQKNIEFARQRSFGVLAVNCESEPLISHIPFHLYTDGCYLEAHLVRVNPIVKLLDEPVEAVIAVSGGDAYISPDWYGLDNQVPTWNYIAVHLRGILRRLEQKALHEILQRLSKNMEDRLQPKKPWTLDKLDEKIYSTLSMQIVPVAMQIHSIDGTWKLSQNKPEAAQNAAATSLQNSNVGLGLEQLAQQMRNLS